MPNIKCEQLEIPARQKVFFRAIFISPQGEGSGSGNFILSQVRRRKDEGERKPENWQEEGKCFPKVTILCLDKKYF